ncbi:Neurochondrin [Oryzias melastigma]|uniref:Neurochondrin n=1 Tax=Oryzias melastigma TaxID=30732 RepID=A0A834F3E1_ORYME|nr:Neurochondrin [Oryzias melastigma]
MAESGGSPPVAEEEEHHGGQEERGLSETQRQMLDRCLHALKQAKNDSHVLAALLLVTRVCPAHQLDKLSLRRIFEAVGLNLPARLLVTAAREDAPSGLAASDLLCLGAALLAALSTDPDMAAHPQLLATVPLLLNLLANGATGLRPECDKGSDGGSGTDGSSSSVQTSGLDKATATDCYQVLTSVCGLPQGPELLLSRGAIPALCRAVEQNQVLSRQRGLPLLGHLLSAKTKKKVWSKHPAELLALLLRLSTDFCQASESNRLSSCAQLVQFLPPSGVALESKELRDAVSAVWAQLRPMLQSRLTPKQIGPVLVLCACLLDLYGWDPAGPPKFCCLLVNRACVEVRMGLEEPPGNELSPELQNTLTGCYRIMEAAMEQACSAVDAPSPAPSLPALSLQQSRQVLQVLQEAFSAVVFYLQQMDASRYGDPFVFASFRSLCSGLAEETSCLKQEVMDLLPFLVGYAQHHLQGGADEQNLSDWMAQVSVNEEGGAWTGGEPLRYLLPALCHLSAEDAPRKVLLGLDAHRLLVDFLLQTWTSLKGRGIRDPSLETACSTLLNFAVTEPERVRTDSCFRTLEAHLSEALPVLVNKPRLLVLAANYCTLGLMIGRLKSPPSGSVESGQRRFFLAALHFLRGALESVPGSGPARVSAAWEPSWDEAAELWRLSLQALGGCARTQPWIPALLRDDGWLSHTLAILSQSSALPDQNTQDALQEALCGAAQQCPLCQQEIAEAMRRSDGGALSKMTSLKTVVGVK